MALDSLIKWRARVAILLIISLSAFAISSFWLGKTLDVLVQSGQNRYQSHLLADELRQSSDDLTRMVRTFAATGKQVYYDQYFEVLAIRNGEAPRPEDYHQVYWDLKIDDVKDESASGIKKPLKDIMMEVGISKDEMMLLNTAQERSDQLVELEVLAMKAINGEISDQDKKQFLPGETKRDFAIRILHGPEYHEAKAQIMEPIQHFLAKVDDRTEAVYVRNATHASSLFSVSILLFIVIAFLIYCFYQFQKKITFREKELLKITNVTLQDEVERRLLAEADLEQRVTERTQELEATVLELHESKTSLERQTIETAIIAEEEASLKEKFRREIEVKNRFFSIIAHDLKSPFTGLLGMTQFMSQMSDQFSKEKLIDYAGEIHTASESLFKLLQNLLEWSRLQIGAVEIEPSLVPLKDVAAASLEVLEPIAAKKNITIRLNFQNEYVYADRYSVETVLRNLVANAIKFTPNDGHVTLSAQTLGSMTEVAVVDTGVGMTDSQVRSVFNIDEKTSTMGTAGETGTGLGLPLCKDLLHKNGGSIWVESKLKEGTAFKFHLPTEPSR